MSLVSALSSHQNDVSPKFQAFEGMIAGRWLMLNG